LLFRAINLDVCEINILQIEICMYTNGLDDRIRDPLHYGFPFYIFINVLPPLVVPLIVVPGFVVIPPLWINTPYGMALFAQLSSICKLLGAHFSMQQKIHKIRVHVKCLGRVEV